jgi:hypothetical protein
MAGLDSDPFLGIPCALLHSGDVLRYATHGALGQRLFEPFKPDALKSASYEVPFVGNAYWWGPSESGMQDQVLDSGTTFEIPPNSIVFIRPAVTMNIPDYLALRFNLHIRLVHRGLLLGTGPLVDPGFRGRLLIPIHNLTDSPVHVNGDDGFIWIEVTKVSTLTVGSPPMDNPDYVPFPPSKRHQEPWQYFRKASNNNPIRSSLPSIKRDAEEASRRVEAQLSRLKVVGLVGGTIALLTVGLSLVQLFESTKQLVVSTQQIFLDAKAKGDEEYRKMVEKIDALEKKLDAQTRPRPTPSDKQ